MPLTARLCSNVEAGISKNGFRINAPDALNMAAAAATSSPNSDLMAESAEVSEGADDTSVGMPRARPPDELISEASEEKDSGVRARRTTG
jgi:hypothetical protein